jgi:hypothetical protein
LRPRIPADSAREATLSRSPRAQGLPSALLSAQAPDSGASVSVRWPSPAIARRRPLVERVQAEGGERRPGAEPGDHLEYRVGLRVVEE